MRHFILVLLTLPAWGLSNAVTLNPSAEVPSTQVHRVPRWFAQGEIQNYPQPYLANTAAASWQAVVKNRWPDGSVRYALVSFPAPISSGSSVVVDFRNSTSACHLGNEATCEAAGLDAAGMLARSWNAEMQVQADPAGSTTAAVINARTMISGGHFTYWIRGPVETVVKVEDDSTARQFDTGWVTTGCSQPYDTCTWSDDATHRSLHPIFMVTFRNPETGVRVEYMLANYWTTARQDQRYSLSIRNSSGEIFSKSDVRSPWSTWWRKVYWDGNQPVAVKIDFNLPYLRHSKMIPPYRFGFDIKESGEYSVQDSITHYQAGIGESFPFWCYSATIQCGSRTKFYAATGGRADRGFYPRWEAQYLHTMRPELLEVVIGNAEYLGAQNIHLRESATGLNYRPGVPAFGLENSIEARPTIWRASDSVANLPTAAGNIHTPNANGTWSQWQPDSAHLHSHSQLAYLLTGDWYFMQEQSFLAHHGFLWFQQMNYMTYARPNNWGFISAFESNHRLAGWLTWNLWRGMLLQPDGTPQREYLQTKLEDALAIFEGYWNVTDGDYLEPCTSDPWSPLTENSRWCWGRKMMGFNTSGPINMGQMIGSSGQLDQLNTSTVRYGSSPWMENFVVLAFFDMCRTSNLGCGVARYHARRSEQAIAEGGNGARLLVWYRAPVIKATQTTLTAGITNSTAILPVTDASVCQTIPGVVRIGNEWIWIASRDLGNNTLTVGSTGRGGRGYNGSSALAASSGAAVQCTDQFATFAEMRTGGTSVSDYNTTSQLVRGGSEAVGDDYINLQCAIGIWSEDFSRSARASEAYRANCIDSDGQGHFGKYSKESDPRWWMESDRPIRQVRASVSGGTATLSYVAPTGAACRVYLGPTPPAASDDSADSLDTAAGRQHSFTASGLSAGTQHYRISCGVVRASGTFAVQ
jgi:hypothetical protein